MTIRLHLAFSVGQPDTTIGMVIIDRVIRVGGKLTVKRDRMAFEADHGLVHAEIGHLRRRMPC